MTQQTTIADIHAATTDELINGWCYSDAHKAVFGFRPRGEFQYTREAVVQFWINFPSYWEQMEAEEEAHLNHLRTKHGIHFENMMAYYTWWEKKEYTAHMARIEAEQAAEEAAMKKAADYQKRRSIIDTIRDFEHGLFKGITA